MELDQGAVNLHAVSLGLESLCHKVSNRVHCLKPTCSLSLAHLGQEKSP